jgi:hypothetical protein
MDHRPAYVQLPDGHRTVARSVSFNGVAHTLHLPPDATRFTLPVDDRRWSNINPAGECCVCAEEDRTLVWYKGCVCTKLRVCEQCALAKHPDGCYKILQCPVCRRDTGMTWHPYTTVEPIVGPLAEGQHTVQIFCRTLRDYTYALMGHPSWTVETLKAIIHSASGPYPDQQRIIWQGRQLEDSRTLADYGISHDSVVHLVERLHGD